MKPPALAGVVFVGIMCSRTDHAPAKAGGFMGVVRGRELLSTPDVFDCRNKKAPPDTVRRGDFASSTAGYLQHAAQQPQHAAQSSHVQPPAQHALAQHPLPQQAAVGPHAAAAAGRAGAAESRAVEANRMVTNLSMKRFRWTRGVSPASG